MDQQQRESTKLRIKEEWKKSTTEGNWLNREELKVFIDNHPYVLQKEESQSNVIDEIFKLEPKVIEDISGELMRELIQKNYKPPMIINSDNVKLNEGDIYEEFIQILSRCGYKEHHVAAIRSLSDDWLRNIIPQIYTIKTNWENISENQLLDTEKLRDYIADCEDVQTIIKDDWNIKFGIPYDQYLNEIIDNYFGPIKKLLIEEKFQEDCLHDQKNFSEILQEIGFPAFEICDEHDREFILTLIKKSEEESDKKKTYVHEPALLRIIQPWFKEHEIQDTSSSAPSTTDSYQGAFMVPVVLIGSLFVGKYLYQKFFKKPPAKKTSME